MEKEKRETKFEDEKLDVDLEDEETTNSSMEIGEEKSEKIGWGTLVSRSQKQKVRILEEGIIFVTEKSKIEIRGKEDLIWEIKGEQYRKDSVKFTGLPPSPGVFWKDGKGKEYGLVFERKRSEILAGESDKIRDKLYNCIMEVQRESDDVGFGLFD